MCCKIFDTHSHYDDSAFDSDREQLLYEMHDGIIGRILDVASTIESNKQVVELCQKYPFVYGAVGVHPDEIGELDEKVFKEISDLTCNKKIVAIGEIGLDYYHHKENKEKQIFWFESFIELSKNKKLPFVVHSRNAAEDTLRVLKKNAPYNYGGVMHCFSYSKEIARDLLDLGFYFGIGGVITFENAVKLKEAVQYIPMENILLETDCPYLAPAPYRGKRNTSLNLPLVAEKIGEIKKMTPEQVVEITRENGEKLFSGNF